MPNIRFKDEFGNEFSQWEKSCLSDRFKFSSGKGLSKDDISEFGSRPCLLYGELFSKWTVIADDKFSLTNAYFKNEKLSDGGEVLIPNSDVTPTGLATASCILKQGVILSGGINVLKPNKATDGTFVAYMLRRFPEKILRIVTGTTVRHLHNSELAKLKYLFPCLEEQKKIAAFFSTLDQRIELNERKLESLEELKKGLMQKIFNRKIRFKKDDGTDFPGWTVSELGNIAEIRGGGTPSTSNSDYWDGNIQWLTPTEINSKYVHESNRKITESGLANSSAKLLPIGTILLTTRATLGACSINNFNGSVCTNQGFQSLVCKPIVLNEYVYYAITFDEFQKKITKHACGSTFLEISAKNLKKLTIPTPSLEEQRKIADFLSTLDLQIDIKKKTVSAMRDLKRGFMQQMFV